VVKGWALTYQTLIKPKGDRPRLLPKLPPRAPAPECHPASERKRTVRVPTVFGVQALEGFGDLGVQTVRQAQDLSP
jgi:hypothetical protein